MASADFSQNSNFETRAPDENAPRDSSSQEAAALLQIRLEMLAKRRNARTLQHEIAVFVALGASVCAPLLLLHRLQTIDLNFAIPAAILASSVGVGILRGRARRIGTFEAALDADRALNLGERLSSALAFSQPTEWQNAQARTAQTRNSPTFRVLDFTKNRSSQTRNETPQSVAKTNASQFENSLSRDENRKAQNDWFTNFLSRNTTNNRSSQARISKTRGDGSHNTETRNASLANATFQSATTRDLRAQKADSQSLKARVFSPVLAMSRAISTKSSTRNASNSRTRTPETARFAERDSRASQHAVTSENTPNLAATSLVPALLQDAAARVRVLDAKAIYPSRFERAAKAMIVALTLVFALLLMPDFQWLRTPAQQKTAAILKEEGEELEQIAKPILKQNALPDSSPTKKMASEMTSLARKMQRGRMGQEEALLGIGQLRRDLEKAVQTPQNEAQPSKSEAQRLREALQNQQMQSADGQQMQQNLQRGDLQKAAENLEKMADKMDDGKMTVQEKQQAAADLKKTAEALRKNGQDDAAKKVENAARSLEKQAQNSPEQKAATQPKNSSQSNQNSGSQTPKKEAQSAQNSTKNGESGSQKSGQQKQNQGEQKSSDTKQNSGAQNGQNQGPKQNAQGQNSQKSGSQQGESSTRNGAQQSESGSQNQNSGQNPNGSQNGDSGSQALRDMAKNLRQGAGESQNNQPSNSESLQRMLDKTKNAEKNAGQNSGQSQSQNQGQSGQNQTGQNAGQSVTPGKDLMPSDPRGAVGGGAGLGPRNNAKGSQSGGGVSKTKGARTGDKRRWQDVWTDRLPKTRKNIDRITGKLGESGEMQQLPTKTEAKGGSARTPYYNVYESYKKDAEDAVAKDSVPPAYKQPVKNYFESLKP